MTSRLLKSLQITARKGQRISEADSCSSANEHRARFNWKNQGWRKQFESVGMGCLAAALFLSQLGPSAGLAQQNGVSPGPAGPRTFAPPVHISPGSATALPPNRHRPRATPGFELVKLPRQKESLGIQDRLSQGFSNRIEKHAPTPARQLPVNNSQRVQVVGSGLLRAPTRPNHEVAVQQSNDHMEQTLSDRQEYGQQYQPKHRQDFRQDYVETVPYSVVETEPFQVEIPAVPGIPSGDDLDRSGGTNQFRGSVRSVIAQEDESAPVRHAFVQEQYLRNQQRVEVELDNTQSSEPFDQSLELFDEPSTHQAQRPDERRRSTPARSTSILNRQDKDQNDSELRPQPAAEQDTERSDGFQEEIDRLDRQFEERKQANQDAPETLPEQSERPRSLLDLDNVKPDDFDTDNRDMDDEASDGDSDDDDNQSKTSLLDRSCDEFRSSLLNTSIRDIALDISPPAINTDQNFMGISRSWTDRQGQIIATGTMVDLRRGYVFLDSGQKIAFARLSESDMAAVSEHWNIPKSCLVGSSGTIERCWQPQSYQWTASSLCHKPLYFEDIQLERYGHTHGPFMQPVHSVAHFFVRLATLPYHSAIHPPNECEYALGLYRPGDCAPWLKDPIPISLDGMKRQALVTTGAAFIP